MIENKTLYIIAGANGSGKTTLLELIQNCCSFVFENDEDFIETNTIKFHKNRKGKVVQKHDL